MGERCEQQRKPVGPRVRQILRKLFEGRPHEHQRVFEHDVAAEAQAEVLLHPLPDYLQLHPSEMRHPLHDQVAVVPPEVMKEDRQLILLPQLQVAPGVRRTSIPTSHMVMVPDLHA